MSGNDLLGVCMFFLCLCGFPPTLQRCAGRLISSCLIMSMIFNRVPLVMSAIRALVILWNSTLIHSVGMGGGEGEKSNVTNIFCPGWMLFIHKQQNESGKYHIMATRFINTYIRVYCFHPRFIQLAPMVPIFSAKLKNAWSIFNLF